MDRITGNLKASISVEAALVFPIVNMVVIIVLTIGMMYHDRCVVREEVQRILFLEENIKTERELGEKVVNGLQDKLLVSEVTMADVSVNFTDNIVEVFMENPFYGEVLKNRIRTSVKVAVHKTKGTNVTRVFDVIIETINEIGM